MSVLYLGLAIALEVSGTISMKLSEGLTRLYPTIAMVVLYTGSFAFLALTLKRLEVSTVYAIWSGVGTALIAVIGVAYFNESLTTLKVASIAMIILGVVGLNLTGDVR